MVNFGMKRGHEDIISAVTPIQRRGAVSAEYIMVYNEIDNLQLIA